ncbi:MAG TPA: hypothetical protein VD865_02770 [Stenotrophomonas sp.]|nr:hypothetical protein [Stenotrophomonas sp.]
MSRGWFVVGVALGLLFTGTAMATQVRGRVDFHGPSGVFPMVNAQVTLCRGPNACGPATVTGADGMYYLVVEPGTYQLLINGAVKQQISIPPGVPLFDVAPLPGS